MTDTVTHLPLKSGEQIPTRDARDWVTSAELMDDTGITYRQVDYWTRTGLLTPLEAATPGSGYLRRFPAHQIRRAAALKALLDAGVVLPVCRAVVDELLAHGHVDLSPNIRLALDLDQTGDPAA